MPKTNFDLRLRECTLDDAEIVSDLESSLNPDDPGDPGRRRHWWRMSDQLEKSMRRGRWSSIRGVTAWYPISSLMRRIGGLSLRVTQARPVIAYVKA